MAPGGAAADPQASPEHGRCDLCAEPLSPRHRHLVDRDERSLRCACRPCALLFDDDAAGGDRYRLVPDRVRRLDDFRLDPEDWAALGVPVDLVFFLKIRPADGDDGAPGAPEDADPTAGAGDAGNVVAFYPAPAGATESTLALGRWTRIEERNPALRAMEPDVEALLVDRRGGEADGWLVPVDECYRLVGLVRTHWKGLAGGSEVHERIERFFDELNRRAPGAAHSRENEEDAG